MGHHDAVGNGGAHVASTRHVTRRGLKLALLVGATLVALAGAEAGLRILARAGVVADFRTPYLVNVADPILEYSLEPASFPGIDARGFRNREALETSCMVAVGDSFTYGYTAGYGEDWPSQLAITSGGVSVYNMGIGGIGPAQYMALTPLALELDPQVLLYGLFVGNDLDNAMTVFTLPYWQEYATQNDLDLSPIEDYVRGYAAFKAERLGTRWQKLRDSTRSSMLLMLLKRVHVLSELVSYRRDLNGVDTGQLLLLRNERIHTIVPPGTHGPVAREGGMALARHFFSRISELAGNTHVLVVFIPSKAHALWNEIEQTGQGSREPFNSDHQFNEQVISELSDFLVNELGLEVLDTTPSLRRAVAQGRTFYPKHAELHTGPEGYRVMAESIAGRLDELGWLRGCDG
jgi:hypothetical protein